MKKDIYSIFCFLADKGLMEFCTIKLAPAGSGYAIGEGVVSGFRYQAAHELLCKPVAGETFHAFDHAWRWTPLLVVLKKQRSMARREPEVCLRFRATLLL